MSKCVKVAQPPEFCRANYLDSNTAIKVYLTDIREANDRALLALALEDIARARNKAEIARKAEITKQALRGLLKDGALRYARGRERLFISASTAMRSSGAAQRL